MPHAGLLTPGMCALILSLPDNLITMKKQSPASLDLRVAPQTEGQPAHRWVYEVLRENLMCGRIRPGIALTIRGLADLLDVSAMPIREALRRLASEKAIEVKGNRRVVVPLMTADKFHELSELRILLEVHAAMKALPHINKADIRELTKLDDLIDRAISSGDTDNIALQNRAFHRHLYAAHPTQEVLPFIESLWLQLGPFSRIALDKLETAYLIDRHEETLQALRQNNAIALGQAIEADIRDGIASIKTLQESEQADLLATA